MDTNQILTLLIAERDRLNQAIGALQGRSPAAAAVGTKGAVTSAPATRGTAGNRRKIVRTPEQRAAQAERMRAYWAKRNNKSTTKKAAGTKRAAAKQES